MRCTACPALVAPLALLALAALARAQEPAVPDAVSYRADLEYGRGKKKQALKLDLSAPKKAAGACPCLVVFHGGGWSAAAARTPTSPPWRRASPSAATWWRSSATRWSRRRTSTTRWTKRG